MIPVGTVIAGGVRSGVGDGGGVIVTLTTKLALALLPALSFALQRTVVVPTGNVAPEAGAHVTDTEPSIASTAVTENVTVPPPTPAA